MKFDISGSSAVAVYNGIKRCVSVCGNVIRVSDGVCCGDPLVKLDFEPQPLSVTPSGIKAGECTVSFDCGRINVVDGKGRAIYSDYAGDATVYAENKDFSLAALEGHKQPRLGEYSFSAQINIALGDGDAVYGLGDKAAAVDRRGYEYVQWNTDDPSQHNETYKSLYKSINFVLISNATGYCGIFYPYPHRTVFNLGAYKPDLLYIGSEHGGYDYFIIPGATPAEVTHAYCALVGLPLLPRLKMLGYQQSRWSYTPESAVRELVSGFIDNDLPLDYVHLDIDYMDGYRVYTVDKAKFPDLKALSADLKRSGVELVTILDPGVKYDRGYFVYDRLEQANGLARHNGEIYHNTVWPGDSVYPDYFDAHTAGLITDMTAEFMENTGVAGIWCDMNEPASFNGPLPGDVMFGEYRHDRVHNLYGEYMVRSVAKAFEKRGERPFIITRACFATSAPFTTVWNGDNQSLWAHLRASLPQIATLNLCGFPLDGVDVGGFGNECTKELLIRWIQANIFSPLLRNHSAIHTRQQEPYAFDGETLDIYRTFLRLRYDTVPYLYDAAYAAHLSGEPIIKPMFYAFPDDENCRRISDQIMIGDYIMLAPVLDAGATHRSVYFPAGEWAPWQGINADKKTHKKGLAAVDMPLGSTGLYVCTDSILPMYSGLNNLSDKPDTLRVRLGGKPAEYINCEDDGRSVDGRYNIYKMSYDGKRFSVATLKRDYDTDYKTLVIEKNGKTVSVPFAYALSVEI